MFAIGVAIGFLLTLTCWTVERKLRTIRVKKFVNDYVNKQIAESYKQDGT